MARDCRYEDTYPSASLMHVSGHEDGSVHYYRSRNPLKHIALASGLHENPPVQTDPSAANAQNEYPRT